MTQTLMTSQKTDEDFEKRLRKEWDIYPDLRDEFDKFKIYFNFKKC